MANETPETAPSFQTLLKDVATSKHLSFPAAAIQMFAVCLEFEFHCVICVSAHLLSSVSAARKHRILSHRAAYGPYIKPRHDPIFCTQLAS